MAGAQIWYAPFCDSEGTADTCLYIGGPSRLGNLPAVDVFSPPADVGTAGDDAATIDASTGSTRT